VAVFPGTPPLLTYSVDGYIYEGTPTARVPIDGARIEVLDGPAAGRLAVSGDPPLLLPGFTPVAAPGMYRIYGVPSGSVRIRVSKGGYIDQEREVAGAQRSGATFYLERR
jgi:hypothetical protein